MGSARNSESQTESDPLVSAHWYIQDAAITVSTAPKTIHDFGGFPRELYQVQYTAPGDPKLAARVQKLLAPLLVRRDERWGLDHGTWSILCHMYPHADIPVVQLSIDETQPPSFHFDVGRRLAPLREEGVLILGSGNVVHNLHPMLGAGMRRSPTTGLSHLKPEFVSCFSQRTTSHSLITRISSAAKPISLFQPPIITFLCSTLQEPARSRSLSHSQLKEWTVDQFQCLR